MRSEATKLGSRVYGIKVSTGGAFVRTVAAADSATTYNVANTSFSATCFARRRTAWP